MGLLGNETHELDSNPGMLGVSENLVQDSNSEALTPGNYKLDPEDMAIETVEHREAENFDTKITSMEETFNGVNEIVPNQEDISKNLGAKEGGLALEYVKISPVLENSVAPTLSQLKDLEDMDLPPGFSYPEPGNGKFESIAKDVTNDPSHVKDSNKDTHVQARKRKTKLRQPVASSRALRSKSQDKPKAPEPNDIAKGCSTNGEKKRRGRKKKQIKENTVDEPSRTKTHLRYLLHRIKYEKNLIDAYSAEGWKGQSLEKLKPEKELERAKSHILRYKLKIRDLFQQLDSSLSVGKLPALLFDPAREIDCEDIFCAKCGSKDLPLDNDIILCDGACERGFHQFCLNPPLLKDDIPLGDEVWLCPGCECKVSCIDMLKHFHGTDISITDSWEKIFPEVAAAASRKKPEDNSILSSDDSEDDDYDPDTAEGEKSCSDESDFVSASENVATIPDNDMALLPVDSEDDEDDDFDPAVADPEEQVKQQSSGSDFTSDSEDLDGLLADSAQPGEDPHQISPFPDRIELPYLIETSEEPVSGKRHVERLDYKKLHDETYGDYSSDSSDEDFGDDAVQKTRKITLERSKAKSTNRTSNSEMYTEDENQKETLMAKDSSATVGSASQDNKRSKSKWIGEDAKKRLYESFNKNQYPERDVRENLANGLGLTMLQVTKWFGHARWSYNHRSKPELNTNEKPPEPGPTIVEGQEPSVVPTQNHVTDGRVEISATNTIAQYSGKWKYRKRKDQTGNNTLVNQNTQE